MPRGRAPTVALLIAACVTAPAGPAPARAEGEAEAATGAATTEPEPIHVSFAASRGCPGEATFLQRVRELTKRPWTAAGKASTRTLRATITASRDGSFRGRLISEDPTGSTRSDEITWDDCKVIVSALAIKTALAIEGGPPSLLPPIEPSLPLLPSLEQPRWMYRPALVRLDARDLPWRFMFGSQLTAAGAVSPGVAPAVSLYVDLSRIGEGEDAATVRISVMRAQSYLLVDQKIAVMQWIASRVEGCPLHRRFDLVTFAPCIALDTGILEWKSNPPGAVRQWVAFDLIARAQLTLFERLVFEAQIALVLPVTRDRFGFGDDEVYGKTIHEVPILSGSAGGGLGVRFP